MRIAFGGFYILLFSSGLLLPLGGWEHNLSSYSFNILWIIFRDFLVGFFAILFLFASRSINRIRTRDWVLITLLVTYAVVQILKYDYFSFDLIHFFFRNLILPMMLYILAQYASHISRQKISIDFIYILSAALLGGLILTALGYTYFGRAYGVFYNPNLAGVFGLFVFFMYWDDLFYARRVGKLISVFFIVVSFFWIIATQSMTGWILFMLASLVYSILRGWRMMVVLGLIALAYIFVYFLFSVDVFPVDMRVAGAFDEEGTASRRSGQYLMYLEAVAASSVGFLLFGSGDEYLTFDSFWIQICFNHGVLGLLVVIGVFSLILHRAWRVESLARSLGIAAMLTPYLVVFTCVLIFGGFGNSFFTKFPFNYFWPFSLVVLILETETRIRLWQQK